MTVTVIDVLLVIVLMAMIGANFAALVGEWHRLNPPPKPQEDDSDQTPMIF